MITKAYGISICDCIIVGGDDTVSIHSDKSDSGEFNDIEEMEFNSSKIMQRLNRHRLSISYSESGIQLASFNMEDPGKKDSVEPEEPVGILNEDSIQTQSDDHSLSSSTGISDVDSPQVLSEEEEEYPLIILFYSSIRSQLSTDSSFSEDSETPSFDITSKYVQNFLNQVGREEATPSVFDLNNRGVDFFLLPVFYCPQHCGISVSSLSIRNNMYIADRYLVIKQLGQATFSITVECIDMKGELNRHLCLKV